MSDPTHRQPTPEDVQSAYPQTSPPPNHHPEPGQFQQPYPPHPGNTPHLIYGGNGYNSTVHFAPTPPPPPPPVVPPLLQTFTDDDRQHLLEPEPEPTTSTGDLYDPDEIERRRQKRLLVARLRTEASELLSARVQERAAAVADESQPGVLPYTEQDKEQLGHSIASDLARDLVSEATRAGLKDVMTPAEQQGLVEDIFNQLFRLGNIQHLVDEPGVEDIFIKGPYTYVKDPATGRMLPRPPAFDTDDEVIEWLQFQAGRAPGGGRAFSKANPELRLNLPGGIRLSAMAYTSEHPSIAIRQHRLRNINLDTLVDYGVMPPVLSRLLEAAVKGAMSIVVAGPMGSGKTTMVRALANALPLDTRIGTAETEFELMLDKIPGREPYVVANETITGGGERNQLTNELVGQTSLTDILYGYVRQMLDRIIVGEVAGPEIIAMYQAMQFCEGTLSTTHATSARGAIDRLVTIALANGGLDRTYAERQAAHHIDLIVQLKSDRIIHADGSSSLNRYVSEVAYVEQGENDRAATTLLYRGSGKHETGDFGHIPAPMIEIITNAGFRQSDIPANTIDYTLDGHTT